jgi:hypothetical protein
MKETASMIFGALVGIAFVLGISSGLLILVACKSIEARLPTIIVIED